MASFDVENLFTNIPLRETIDICLNKLFTDPTSTVIGLSRVFFKKLLEHAVLNSFFLFNGVLYKQIDGVGMGLPLGPTFANLFMCSHETQWLDDCPLEFRPVLYQRYVDDTFLLFKQQSHASLFLNFLNSRHSNIKFTMECEINSKLSFLDVLVSRENNRFDTSVFRKDSFTGLGTSFFSLTPHVFEINCIKTMLSRAYGIYSNYVNFHAEIVFLKSFFTLNGYSFSLFYSQVNKFLSKKY
jgi:hypothetical protein